MRPKYPSQSDVKPNDLTATHKLQTGTEVESVRTVVTFAGHGLLAG